MKEGNKELPDTVFFRKRRKEDGKTPGKKDESQEGRKAKKIAKAKLKAEKVQLLHKDAIIYWQNTKRFDSTTEKAADTIQHVLYSTASHKCGFDGIRCHVIPLSPSH